MLMKTSNSLVRSGTQSRLQKLRIGDVPDRGGRSVQTSVGALDLR